MWFIARMQLLMEKDRLKTHQTHENDLGLASFCGSCNSADAKYQLSAEWLVAATFLKRMAQLVRE